MSSATTDPGLILKIAPPKLRRNLLVRERLCQLRLTQDAALYLIEAPAGYGKTSLLTKWRLDWLQSGALVAWYDSGVGDSAHEVFNGLVEGLRQVAGRQDFLLEAQAELQRGNALATAMTALLADIVEAAAPMVLILDNGERLTRADTLELLNYLLRNLPPNLQVVIATRSSLPLACDDLLAHGELCRLTSRELGFEFVETQQFLQQCLGSLAEADLCARLHELTGGWPLGLHLASLALAGQSDPRQAMQTLEASRDDATQLLFAGALARLSPRLNDFVLRCALLDALHPELCAAVSGDADAPQHLQQLLAETPLLTATEAEAWLRFHPLAREYLRAQALQSLDAAQREAVHGAAWHWFVGRGDSRQAVQHALQTRHKEQAYSLLASCLSDVVVQGYPHTVIELLEQVPAQVLRDYPQIRIWAGLKAFLEGDSQAMLDNLLPLLDAPEVAPADRDEALYCLSIAAAWSERLRSSERYSRMLPERMADSRVARCMANNRAYLCLQRGETEAARRFQSDNPDDGRHPGAKLYSEVLLGYSYLWEGRPLAAERALRERYPYYEQSMGRRNLMTTPPACLLAAACWERDERETARHLLAHRLDLMGRYWFPEGSDYGHRTLALMALADGDPDRALALLDALLELGRAGGRSRHQALALLESIRLYAIQQHSRPGHVLLQELDDLCARDDGERGALQTQLELQRALATSYLAFADEAHDEAQRWLGQAGALAVRLNRGREQVQVLALQALLAARRGAPADALLEAALALAEAGDQVRVFVDTWPGLLELIRGWRSRAAPAEVGLCEEFLERVLGSGETRCSVAVADVGGRARRAILTAKEDEVLQLLANGLPNKRIASSLGLSDETIKWHLKKLFIKLDASSRQHAVQRARMLGLLP